MNTLYGLIGQSLAHSISPVIHKIIFDRMDISACYHLLEVEEYMLEDTVKDLMSVGSIGVNVTIPYKIKIMKYMDELAPEAEAIGAVNCILFGKHGTIGYNTDYFGFGSMLERHNIEIAGKNATVMGTGGAARTVISYLLDHGIDNIIIVTRNIRNSDLLTKNQNYRRIKRIDYSHLSMIASGDLIINCTPCGMYPNIDESPVNIDTLSGFDTAIDIIYNPLETKFLRQARQAGLRAVNGLYMLVSQAVAAQEIWHDVRFRQSNIDEIYKKVKDDIT
jgi:shikimate dehydrogenase